MAFDRLLPFLLVATIGGCASAPGGLSRDPGSMTDLPVYRVVLDPAALAGPLHLSPDQVVAVFRDGRVANAFCRRWADRHLAPVAGHSIRAARLKTLTGRSSLKLQLSVKTGANRPADPDDVATAIAGEANYLIADIRGFPTVDFILVDADWFAARNAQARLTTTGWSAEETYRELRQDYRLVVQTVPLT